MKKFGFATLIASGLTAAVLGFAGPAQADIVTTSPTVPHYSVDNHDENQHHERVRGPALLIGITQFSVSNGILIHGSRIRLRCDATCGT
jgi:hypothetical protein